MQNRREHYRHTFPSKHRLRATLGSFDGRYRLSGEVVNLSLGGICLKLEEQFLGSNSSIHVRFELEGDTEPVELRVERVYAHDESDTMLGLRFIFPIHASVRDHLERKISKYLLDVQRYERQIQRESRKSG